MSTKDKDTQVETPTPAEKLEKEILGKDNNPKTDDPRPVVLKTPVEPEPKHITAEEAAAKAADASKKVTATEKPAQANSLAWAAWFEKGLYALLVVVAAIIGGLIAKSDESAIAERVFARVQAMGQTPAATMAPIAKSKTPAKAEMPKPDKKNKPAAPQAQPEETIQLAPGMTPVAEEK